MNLLRLPVPARKRQPDVSHGTRDVFRRFFDLIERLEKPRRPEPVPSAPETKARITRLDDDRFPSN